MRSLLSTYFLLFVETSTAFTLCRYMNEQTIHRGNGRLFADANDGDGLILNGLDQEMGQMKSKYGFTESDFLAAARKRAEQKVESSNSGADDSDWQAIAEEKRKMVGEIDDWENSRKEAGNLDSQILMFTEPSEGSEDDDGSDEPKLLLY